jgi:hypothetical protein
MVDNSYKQDNMNYNFEVSKKLELTSQEVMLLNSLEDFYKKKNNYDLFHSIINGTNTISRRTIEYFVTNYALNNKICYDIEERGHIVRFNVYTSYKDQLKAHRKKYFDPFGRGERIPFFTNNDCIITTIGQLNFYKWFFSKNIYNYCIDNYEKVQNSLVNSKVCYTKKSKIPTKNNTKKPNIRYDYTPKKEMSHNGDIIVSFDI